MGMHGATLITVLSLRNIMSSMQALRGAPLRQAPFSQARAQPAASRSLVVSVEANKRVQKKTKVPAWKTDSQSSQRNTVLYARVVAAGPQPHPSLPLCAGRSDAEQARPGHGKAARMGYSRAAACVGLRPNPPGPDAFIRSGSFPIDAGGCPGHRPHRLLAQLPAAPGRR